MKLDRVSRAALRISMQLDASPRSVASAIAWRAVRRPVLRLHSSATRARRASAARLRPHLHWAQALLATSLPPPPSAVACIVGAKCVAFGRSWDATSDDLAAIDPRFGVEAWRLQHLHALAAMQWHVGRDSRYAAEIAKVHDRPAELLARSLQEALGTQAARMRKSGVAPYPMDHAMRAVSVLLAHAALMSGAAADPARASGDEFADDVAALVTATVDHCFSDPEYSGRLSNNHHLTTVACLMLLLASVDGSPAGRDPGAESRDTRFRTTTRWLVRAVREQFAADGVHFEHSTGYHMCAVESLVLAGLALLEPPAEGSAPATSPRSRWDRLHEAAPEVAGALAGAVRFADAVTRGDGTYPLVGDFDASRIVRTRAVYRSPGRERFAGKSGPGLVATVFERVDANATSGLVHALFELPGTATQSAAARMDPSARAHSDPAWAPVPRSTSRAPIQPQVSTAREETDLRSMTELVRSSIGSQADAAGSSVRYRLAVPRGSAGFEIQAFPHSGLLLVRASTLLATLRSGTPGQHGIGTHSHLDHLSSDIWIQDGDCIADPGSWCYGSCIPLRNRYRSNAGHFSPTWQLDWSKALQHPFCLVHAPPGALLGSDASSIWGVLRLPSGWVARRITVEPGAIVVLDASSEPGLSPFPLQQLPATADGYFGPLQREANRVEVSTCAA